MTYRIRIYARYRFAVERLFGCPMLVFFYCDYPAVLVYV